MSSDDDRPGKSRPSARKLIAVAGAGVVALLVLVAIAVRSSSDPPKHVGVRMVPKVSDGEGRAEFKISLPTGQRYIVSTPDNLDIASLGGTASVTITWDGQPEPATGTCCERVVRFRYATPGDLFPDTEPVTRLASSARMFERGATGAAELGAQRSGGWIVLPAERWSAVVDVTSDSQGYAPLSIADQELLATSFDAHAGPDGFPVLRLQPPLVADVHSAAISFGGPSDSGQPYLALSPFFCGDPGSHTSEPQFSEHNGVQSVAWCNTSIRLFVFAQGPASFVHAIADGLHLQPT